MTQTQPRHRWITPLAFLMLLCLIPCPGFGQDTAAYTPTYTPTANMMGQLGLNTVPSARMDKAGTFRATLSREHPYTHATLGMQMTDHLFVALRQTSQSHSFLGNSDHLYPGLDLKWSVVDERRYRPQIAIGLQSALGHKRMAAEYVALSKRYQAIDFTFGFGWGRLASGSSLPNPALFQSLSGHSSRALDGENPNTPHDWFRGDMGLLGGIDYATPITGLSVKADISTDTWTAEKTADPDIKTPATWSVGVSYRPTDWMDTGLAYMGGDTVMARISFSPSLAAWPRRDLSSLTPQISLRPHRSDEGFFTSDDSADDEESDEDTALSIEQRLGLSGIFVDGTTSSATLTLPDHQSTPFAIGEAARYLANMSGTTAESLTLHLRQNGLQGNDITLNRTDLERAFLYHHGSPEEIWRTTIFSAPPPTPHSLARYLAESQNSRRPTGFKLDLIHDISLSEDDSGILYRSGLRGSWGRFFGRHFLSFHSLRLNIADNLKSLNTYRPLSLLPVRADIDTLTRNRLMLEREFLTGFVTPARDTHAALTFGYLEEMYMGLVGEVLYRPFGKNWAIGAEADMAFKRDPYSFSALAPNGDHILSGFVNAYYDIPNSTTTLKASAGRYLAGDIGGSLSLTNTFRNGVTMAGDITATNTSDNDVYGGRTNIYTGIHLSIPLGGFVPFLPNGSRMITNAAPLGRDRAQRLDNPVPLYDMTEPLSYRHITQYWGDISP